MNNQEHIKYTNNIFIYEPSMIKINSAKKSVKNSKFGARATRE